jgi:hypothetical protein
MNIGTATAQLVLLQAASKVLPECTRAVRDAFMANTFQSSCSHRNQLQVICRATLRASPHHHRPSFTAESPPCPAFAR